MVKNVKIIEKGADIPYVQAWIKKAGPELAEEILEDTLDSFKMGVSEGYKKGVREGFASAMAACVIGAIGSVGVELYREYRKYKKSKKS